VRKMGRRGRPEVLALQLPQGPEQLTVANLGPASKLLQEGGQERVALQHIQGFVARITCHCCESVSLRVKSGFPEAGWMGFKT
jgi:hypothetical protein